MKNDPEWENLKWHLKAAAWTSLFIILVGVPVRWYFGYWPFGDKW